jgi:hypothetical protein
LARGPYCGDANAYFGLKSRVGDGEPGRGGDVLEQGGVVENRGVVDEREQPCVRVVDQPDRASRVMIR